MTRKGLRGHGSITFLDIVVTTGSSRDEISGFDEWRERLIVRVRDKPIGGRANHAVVRLFSDKLNLPVSRIRLTAGKKSSKKTIEVQAPREKVNAALSDVWEN